MAQNTWKKRPNTVITEIALTRKQKRANKPYRHQQHLPEISQNVSGAVQMVTRYGRNT